MHRTNLKFLAVLAVLLLTAAVCARAAYARDRGDPNRDSNRNKGADKTKGADRGNGKGSAKTPDSESEKESPDGEVLLKLSDYTDLLNRNLFSREQKRRRPEWGGGDRTREEPDRLTMSERESSSERESNGKGEADIVLIGIVDKDGAMMAFLEDRKAGKPLAVKTGDKLAGGKVGTISLSSMEYLVGEKTTSIVFGSNLQGGVSSAKPLDSSGSTGPGPAGAGGDASKGGAGSGDDANLSVIEKLRRKRAAEGNK